MLCVPCELCACIHTKEDEGAPQDEVDESHDDLSERRTSVYAYTHALRRMRTISNSITRPLSTCGTSISKLMITDYFCRKVSAEGGWRAHLQPNCAIEDDEPKE